MKAILQFQLPEEANEHKIAVQAPDVLTVLYDLDRWLRNEIKYGQRPEEQERALQRCRDKLWDLIDDTGVDIDL
jgi:hypothetical protein